ncbi:Queuine tRNA-ribosyltransferase, partial [Giardia duodenalis]
VNDPAGVSIDSLCRPASSPQATAAGCAGSDGAALTDSSTACEMCSGGFFLFMGGCYSTESNSGSEICTAANGGKCTICKTEGNYIFKNPATTVTPGNECILCSDATNRDGYQGVENCNTCTAPSGTGPATCSVCQEGYYLNDADKTCKPCTGCATCENAANTCTSCPEGKYLKSDNTCVEEGGCTGNTYPDPETMTCKACTEIHAQCTRCSFDSSKGRPQCSACTGQILKTELDGTVTCVEEAQCATGNTHFKTDDNRCVPCSDTTGIANCATCSDKTTCITCLEGYIKEGDNAAATCEACGTGCATCSEAGNANKCLTCMAGFFLVGTADNGQCVSCGDTAKGGIEGCAECSGTTGSLKCTSCKPNYRKQQNGDANDDYTCAKACEDPTACGGTAGACNAIVIGANGEMTYYCSLCGDSTKIPIDGKCVDSGSANGNTCANGVCTSCTTGYFLYMGGLLQCVEGARQPHVLQGINYCRHLRDPQRQQQVLRRAGGSQD